MCTLGMHKHIDIDTYNISANNRSTYRDGTKILYFLEEEKLNEIKT